MKRLGMLFLLLMVSGCAVNSTITRKQYLDSQIKSECPNSLTKKHQWAEKISKDNSGLHYFCQHCLKEIERP